MLIRQPEHRASLDEIMLNKWIRDCGVTQTSLTKPLIYSEMINENEHNDILVQMIEGKVASREEILRYGQLSQLKR